MYGSGRQGSARAQAEDSTDQTRSYAPRLEETRDQSPAGEDPAEEESVLDAGIGSTFVTTREPQTESF